MSEAMQIEAIRLIEKQQEKAGQGTAPWMVGEQLKEICRREPRSAELLAGDLNVAGMSIIDAEKKIKAYADAHKKGSFACVPPMEADRILREFYGLGGPGPAPEIGPALVSAPAGPCDIDLADFFGAPGKGTPSLTGADLRQPGARRSAPIREGMPSPGDESLDARRSGPIRDDAPAGH